MLLHSLDHIVHEPLSPVGLSLKASLAAKLHIIAATYDEEAGDHQRLGLRAFCLVLSGLE